MSEDRHAAIRNLPFDVVARALGTDLSKFSQRKSGTEWTGHARFTAESENGTAFSYSVDGKFNCFSCSQKGRGAIDLAMKIRSVGFQAAVELLEPYANPALLRKAVKPV